MPVTICIIDYELSDFDNGSITRSHNLKLRQLSCHSRIKHDYLTQETCKLLQRTTKWHCQCCIGSRASKLALTNTVYFWAAAQISFFLSEYWQNNIRPTMPKKMGKSGTEHATAHGTFKGITVWYDSDQWDLHGITVWYDSDIWDLHGITVWYDSYQWDLHRDHSMIRLTLICGTFIGITVWYDWLWYVGPSWDHSVIKLWPLGPSWDHSVIRLWPVGPTWGSQCDTTLICETLIGITVWYDSDLWDLHGDHSVIQLWPGLWCRLTSSSVAVVTQKLLQSSTTFDCRTRPIVTHLRQAPRTHNRQGWPGWVQWTVCPLGFIVSPNILDKDNTGNSTHFVK